MLNLNYNINNALGKGYCRGLEKYNYSASLIVVAGGGGGGDYTQTEQIGGGGGGGAAITSSISIVPNVTYQINVGAGGAKQQKGQSTSFIGYDDNSRKPYQIFCEGGFPGDSSLAASGGNSGTGSIFVNGINTLTTIQKIGGSGVAVTSPYTYLGGGGGASNDANGGNAIATPPYQGGDGGNGISAGGGGGWYGAGPTGPIGRDGLPGSATSNSGIGGNGGAAGSGGSVIISYSGKQKAFVTGNVTTTYDGATTTHIFSSGSGTFLYTFPYPWEQPVTPYEVTVCPPTYLD